MSCVQFLQIPSGEVEPEPRALKTIIPNFKGATSNVALFWATQHEDKKTMGIASVWQSLDAQKNWDDSPAGQETRATINEFATGPIHEDTVLFSQDPRPTLAASVVELVSWIHPTSNITDENKMQIDRGFKKFQEAITTRAPQSDGGIVAGWGRVEFDFKGIPSRRYTLLIGWKSVQAHYDCKSTALFAENIHWLMDYGHSDTEMFHYPYSQSIGKE